MQSSPETRHLGLENCDDPFVVDLKKYMKLDDGDSRPSRDFIDAMDDWSGSGPPPVARCRLSSFLLRRAGSYLKLLQSISSIGVSSTTRLSPSNHISSQPAL